MSDSSGGEKNVIDTTCPLCGCRETRGFAKTAKSSLYRCPTCSLIFRNRGSWPSREAEKARYEKHRNVPGDKGYIAFLRRLVEPLARHLEGRREGLDFGSGPTPVLSSLVRELGHEMHDYDPLFTPDEGALSRSYDFITCCEVIEHMHRPIEELELMDGLLPPGGILVVMTGMVDDSRDFGEWSYARDTTHVCFYSPETMDWIASRLGWTIEERSGDVTVFRKPVAGGA